jgi:hypothetical protein
MGLPHGSRADRGATGYLAGVIPADASDGMSEEPRQRYRELQRVGAILAGSIDAKPPMYAGVAMRSKLEADFARHLDRLGIGWAYEPRVFGSKGSGYLPDFQITRDGVDFYIEVKPTLGEVPEARSRMEVIWKREPKAMLLVACAEGCTFWTAAKGKPWESFVELWKHA